MGKVILITSGKGGCGKTTFAVNLGCSYAKRGKKTILVDLNIGTRNLDIYMGLESKVLFDMSDYFLGTCRLSKAIVQSESVPGLYLLSCPQLRGISGLTQAHIKVLCDKLKDDFDYVILDVSSSLADILHFAAAVSDEVLVIVTPDFSAVRNGETIDKKLENYGAKKRCFAINKMMPDLMDCDGMPDLRFIMSVFTTPLAGLFSFDYQIHIANNTGIPAAADDSNPMSKAFDELASRLS